MELHLTHLETLWNSTAKSTTMSASEKFAVYEYVSRQLELTVQSTRRVGGMTLESAVSSVNPR